MRYLSLLKANVVLYDLAGILNRLCISFDDFQDICILSGTDYNLAADSNIELHRALKLFARYRKRGVKEGYHKWIIENSYITDVECYYNTKEMFNINGLQLNKNNLVQTESDENEMQNFLLNYGFVFAY